MVLLHVKVRVAPRDRSPAHERACVRACPGGPKPRPTASDARTRSRRAPQRNEEQQFLMETTVTASVADTCSLAATLLELSLRMQALAAHGEELASYGPAKPEAEEGLDEEIVGGTITGEPMIKGPNYTPDPTGRRTGEAPNPQTAEGACPHPPTATAHGPARARRH